MGILDAVANFFTGNQQSVESVELIEQPEQSVEEQQDEVFRQAVAALQAKPMPITREEVERAKQRFGDDGDWDDWVTED